MDPNVRWDKREERLAMEQEHSPEPAKRRPIESAANGGQTKTVIPEFRAAEYPGPRVLSTGHASWGPGLRYACPG